MKVRSRWEERADVWPEMIFEEIGEAMGISAGHAFLVYCRAMRKLVRVQMRWRRNTELGIPGIPSWERAGND